MRLYAGAGGVMRKLIVYALLGWLISMLPNVNAQAQLTLEVEVGLGGRFLPDHHTPIRVRIIYDGPPLTGELILRQRSQQRLEGVRTIELRRPVRLGGKARPLYESYLPLSDAPPPGGDEPELVAVLESQGHKVASRRVVLTDLVSPEPLVLMLSDGGYLKVLPTGERVISLTAEQLPEDWRGYAGVRRIYLGRFNLGLIEPSKREALSKWLIRGGELVVLAGQNAYLQDVPWLEEILPFHVEDVRWIEELGAHVAVGRGSGEVLHSEAGLALLLRGRVGLGRIYFSALDLRGRSEAEKAIWKALTPERIERPRPLQLGPELFSKMELIYPDKLMLGGLLVLYLAGIGLFSLWTLRNPQWSGWRVLIIVSAWLGLFSAGFFAYLKRPEFSSRVQALEIGIIWGMAGGDALLQGWYSALAKQAGSLELAFGPDTLLLPLGGTSYRLRQGSEQVLRFLPGMEAGSTGHLYFEEVLPLQVTVELGEGRLIRVRNGSSWPLRDVVFWREGIYYPLGDLAGGGAREEVISGLGANSWLKADGWGFEQQVKWSIFKAAQAELERLKPKWMLLGWMERPSLKLHPAEDRWIVKLLVLMGAEGGVR